MDYIEQMVVKKRSKADIFLVLAVALGSIAVVALAFALLFAVRGLAIFLFLIVAGVIYFAYNFSVSRNVEYEYSMVANEIEVDKILNQTKRKRMTVLNVKKLTDFGRVSQSSECRKLLSDVAVKKIYACEDKNADDTFFAVYVEDGITKMLLFTPCEEIVEWIVKYNPGKQFEL